MSEIPRHSRALYTPPNRPPAWTRSRSASTISSSLSTKTTPPSAFSRGKKLLRWARKRFHSLTLLQRIVLIFCLLLSATIGILTLIFHTQILAALLPISTKLRSLPAGWMVIFTLCFVSAFPPMIGYSTSVTLAGFVYGFPHGWFIVASGTVIGSTTAFVACRHLFKNFSQRLVATDKRFEALSLTLKHDGLKLLCAIRLCPLPYSISNGAVSTFPTVTPAAFAFATAVATPKLLIHTWIGHRLAVLAAADEKMDRKTKMVNYGTIVAGLLLGAVTGWVIWRRTMKRAAMLEAAERERLNQEQGLLQGQEYEDLVEEERDLEGILDGDEEESEEEGRMLGMTERVAAERVKDLV
ncbi:hypothetical protein BZA77DRAFT_180572 [Pyronema omphalodes]|nr:hypothetical protein BZA77DRAFT_180572 [Pyronema omphalodes]